ncbi:MULTISPECIES: hypothetical protein [Streptomyces]|uniref:Sugar kinase n=2 Tax=Streptomyces TaxID=1883 RepID=A0A3Q9G209_STRLT|nr:hypothetical protein [Streptomyces luteoverticillatus]AZQ74152.1 hypothetical protein EKH77_25625 [Streptomyces luteoverticillatus]
MQPEQLTTPGEPLGPPRRAPRWVKPLIIFLLVAIPAGYLYISAMQSRGGSESKREEAAQTGLESGWPSRLQRRIYGMTVPPGAAYVAHYETNSWKSSSLYLQFTTTGDRLDHWLEQLGTSSAELQPGKVTIDKDEADVVGWKFGPDDHHWRGTAVSHDKPEPNFEIVVNWDNPNRPRAYVISTTTP